MSIEEAEQQYQIDSVKGSIEYTESQLERDDLNESERTEYILILSGFKLDLIQKQCHLISVNNKNGF